MWIGINTLNSQAHLFLKPFPTESSIAGRPLMAILRFGILIRTGLLKLEVPALFLLRIGYLFLKFPPTLRA